MKIDKKEVGKRIKSFLQDRFGTVKEGAKMLGTTTVSLSSSYFNGKSLPGATLLLKLESFGCDTHWLLTGETSDSYYQKKLLDAEARAIYWEECFKEISDRVGRPPLAAEKRESYIDKSKSDDKKQNPEEEK